MTIFNSTVEVARWIPILALVYILFLQGLLIYIVHLRYRERLQMIVEPNTGNTPRDNKDKKKPVEQRTGGKCA